MPAVVARAEATGVNYKHRIGISQSTVGGSIVQVIDEAVNVGEETEKYAVNLEAPSGLTVT